MVLRLFVLLIIAIAAIHTACPTIDPPSKNLSVYPDLMPYTSAHTTARLLVSFRGNCTAYSFMATYNGTKLLERPVVWESQGNYAVTFQLSALPEGTDVYDISCSLTSKQTNDTDTVRLTYSRLDAPSNMISVNLIKKTFLTKSGDIFIPYGYSYDYDWLVNQTQSTWDAIAARGFTTVYPRGTPMGITAEWEKLMDAIHLSGLKVYYSFEDFWHNKTAVASHMQAFKNHPAVFAWNIGFEEDAKGVQPTELKETYRFIKSNDAFHPVTNVLGCMFTSEAFGKTADVAIAAVFPIGIDTNSCPGPTCACDHCSGAPTDVVNRLKKYNLVNHNLLPIIPMLQAKGNVQNPTWKRQPSEIEMKYMVFASILQNVMYGINFSKVPEVSETLFNTTAHMKAQLASMISITTNLESSRSIGLLAADFEISYRAWDESASDLYMMMANDNDLSTDVVVNFKNVNYDAKVQDLLFNDDKDRQVENGKFTEELSGYSVRFFHISHKGTFPILSTLVTIFGIAVLISLFFVIGRWWHTRKKSRYLVVQN
mmetsp:Transcript_15675/g.17427  ORF Transcript_15675/g.17427 Transcript_15675/m.17427 type:complete len:540 (+) Transcript_15675:15-1634(+)